MLCQTLSHTLKLAPHERPSTQPLTKNPQQLCYFLCQTLTKDPQQVWQTLKNFDYPNIIINPNTRYIESILSLLSHQIPQIQKSQVKRPDLYLTSIIWFLQNVPSSLRTHSNRSHPPTTSNLPLQVCQHDTDSRDR